MGSYITENGKCDVEIKRRTGLAKVSFDQLGNILKNQKMPMPTRVGILQCYVTSTLLYGCECWTISAEIEKKLEATEMWYWRRMLRISWTDHVMNEEVLRRAGTEMELV